MKRRTSVREHVAVGRVSLLVMALVCALAAWFLFDYGAPGPVVFTMAGIAAFMGLTAFVTLPPGRKYSFASRRRDSAAAGGRAAPAARVEHMPAVSRPRLAIYSALLGLSAALVHWFGGPREFVWILALCAGLYAAVALLPAEIRRLLASEMRIR